VTIKYSQSRLIVLILFAIAGIGTRVLYPTEIARNLPKNPKLSTSLVLLSQNVKQQREYIATPGAVENPNRFSTENLPKPLRDGINSGQMRITGKGEVQVYIELSAIDRQNLDELRSLGVIPQIIGKPKADKTKGEVPTKTPTVQALLPLTMINQVSALPFVRYVRLPDYAFKNTGSVDSQGDQILKAVQAREQFGFDGTGVRVGVISDGIGGIFATGCTTCGPTTDTPSPINTGDLPSATGIRDSNGMLTSATGGIVAQSFFTHSSPDLEAGAEGTAMLEIVHDLAPGAQLYFANADSSMAFMQAVNYIAANTDIGVDDESTFTPPFDGTSDVSLNTASALNTDGNPIRGYFTAVGNQVFNHWGEPWNGSGQNVTLACPVSMGGGVETGQAQLFHSTANTVDSRNAGQSIANVVAIPNGKTLQVFLSWDDPFSGSTNDYDLFLYLVQNGQLVEPLSCSVNPSTGTQPAREFSPAYMNTSGSTQQVGILILNVNNLASPRNFDMFVEGTGVGNVQNLNFYTASGSVPAQADAGGTPVSVVSVGATSAQVDSDGHAPGTAIEIYSSQGPTELTPQAASRMKPDITATDGVSVTGAGGFGFGDPFHSTPCPINNPSPPGCYFFGTSAAAPHAAAIAALVLESMSSSSSGENPSTVRANLRNALTSTAVPLSGISQPVPNNVEGYGILDALSAVSAVSATGPSNFTLSSNPSSLNIPSGQSGSSTITVTGMAGLVGSVSLACDVSPVPANDAPICRFSRDSVTLSANSSSANTTLYVATIPRFSSGLRPFDAPNRLTHVEATAGIAVVCIVLMIALRQKRRSVSVTLLLLVCVALILGSCASGGSNGINLGTPPGAYTVTITASSGKSTQSTGISLNIQ
jgi:hypothetical protein